MKIRSAVLFFLLAQYNYLFSQNTYSISWASTQAKWVFPIFFEDAIGQKDTLYFGYDSRTLSFPGQQDFRFGEQGFAVDTVALQVAVNNFPTPDSVLKVNIFSDETFYLYPDGYLFPVYLYNAYPPITLRYDNTVLYSDSLSPLPYPNQTITPKAQALIDWFYTPNYIDCGYETVLITDTVVSGPINYCQKLDSCILESVFGNNFKQDFYLAIGFAPWRGFISVSTNEIDKLSTLSVFPNPSINEVNIVSEENLQSVSLISPTGVELFEKDFKSSITKYTLAISNFENGIYFLRVKFYDKTIIKRLIVTH